MPKWPVTWRTAARSACPHCKSWPGPFWRQPSFDSTIELAFRNDRPASELVPLRLHSEETNHALYLCVRIGGPHDLETVVPGHRGGAWPGIGLLGHGPARRLGRARAPGAASAAGVAGRWREPARNMGPQARHRYRRPVPVDRDFGARRADFGAVAINGQANAPAWRWCAGSTPRKTTTPRAST